MGDEDHTEPLARPAGMEVAEQRNALGLMAEIEVGGRLVKHQEPWPLGERAREHDPLTLPAR